MREDEMDKFVGMVADIAYEIHDMDGIHEELKEKLLELWRSFDYYNRG